MQTMAMLGHMYNMMATITSHFKERETQQASEIYHSSQRATGGQKRSREDTSNEERPQIRRRTEDTHLDGIGIAKGDFKDLRGKSQNKLEDI